MKVVVIHRVLDSPYSGEEPELIMITSGTVRYAESLFRELEVKRRAEVESVWKASDKYTRVPYKVIQKQKYSYWADEHELHSPTE